MYISYISLVSVMLYKLYVKVYLLLVRMHSKRYLWCPLCFQFDSVVLTRSEVVEYRSEVVE